MIPIPYGTACFRGRAAFLRSSLSMEESRGLEPHSVRSQSLSRRCRDSIPVHSPRCARPRRPLYFGRGEGMAEDGGLEPHPREGATYFPGMVQLPAGFIFQSQGPVRVPETTVSPTTLDGIRPTPGIEPGLPGLRGLVCSTSPAHSDQWPGRPDCLEGAGRGLEPRLRRI